MANMHPACEAPQLGYVGSATLPENFEDLLPSAIRQLLEQEPSPASSTQHLPYHPVIPLALAVRPTGVVIRDASRNISQIREFQR
jgi:hypothetical protein